MRNLKERSDAVHVCRISAHFPIWMQRSAPMDSPAVAAVGDKNFTFRNMTRQDYFCLYDAIHTLVRQDEISKEEVRFPHSSSFLQSKSPAMRFSDKSRAMEL